MVAEVDESPGFLCLVTAWASAIDGTGRTILSYRTHSFWVTAAGVETRIDEFPNTPMSRPITFRAQVSWICVSGTESARDRGYRNSGYNLVYNDPEYRFSVTSNLGENVSSERILR